AGVLSKIQTPLCGSPTADTSLSVRSRQPASSVSSPVCQAGLAHPSAHPDPVPSQAVSVQPRLVVRALSSDVPPTETTNCEDAGNSGPYPSSPADATMATPGWSKYFSSLAMAGPPKLLETNLAPRETAASSAASRLAGLESFATTRRMWQLGQM